MAEEVTATLVVRFGEFISASDTANGIIVLEVDDRPLGLNEGSITFFAGEAIGLLVYRSSNVSNPILRSSIGNVLSVGSGSRVITQIITFSNSDSASLSHPANGGVAHVWLGSNGGGISIENQKIIKLGSKFTGVLEVTYTTNFLEKSLVNTPGEINGSANYTVVISAVGEVLVL